MAKEPDLVSSDNLPDPVIRVTADVTRMKDEDLGTVTVDGDEELSIKYEEDDPNLVEAFSKVAKGKKFLRKFSDDVIQRFDDCFDNSREYRERLAEDWRIFSGDLPPKQPPFENVSNAHVPILLENMTRLYMRASQELFGDWRSVFGVEALNVQDRPIADVLSKHGNWQIREQIPDFRRQFGHRGMLHFFVNGDVCSHSYYSNDLKQNRHEILTADEFITPYVHVTTMPDYSDLPYYFKVMHRYRHQIERHKDVWFEVDRVIKKESPSWEDEPTSVLRDTVADVQGVHKPSDDRRAPYKLLHYEGWEKLPEQKMDRWVKAIIDYRTHAVLSLEIFEEDDWQDKLRYEQQMGELMDYRQAEQAWQQVGQAQLQQEALLNQVDSGAVDGMAPEQLDHIGGVLQDIQANPLPTDPPVPPAWLDPDDPEAEPAKIRKVPIRMFSHGVCIEPMVGNLGIAPGRIVSDLNRAANVALSIWTDAASLANNWSIITTDLVEFQEPFNILPGKVNKATGTTGMDLQNGIKELRPGPANDQLINLVNMTKEWGQSSVHSNDVMSGVAGKSGESWRGLSARIEQATRNLAGYTQKYAVEFLENVLKNNARLNAIYLPEEEIININLDKMQGPEQLRIGRAMYERDYRVTFAADLRFATESQRIAEADEMAQMPQIIPPLQQNIPFLYQAAKRMLEARRLFDLIPFLGPEPPPPDQPLGLPPPPPPGAMPMGPNGQPMSAPEQQGPPPDQMQ